MIVKEVQDFYEIEVFGIQDNLHVIYEKINELLPVFNEKHQFVCEKEGEIYENISVYQESGSLIKKANYSIGTDVNNVAEAIGIISHMFAKKLSAWNINYLKFTYLDFSK